MRHWSQFTRTHLSLPHPLLHLHLGPLTRSLITRTLRMSRVLRLHTRSGAQSWRQLVSTVSMWRWMMHGSWPFLLPTKHMLHLVSCQCQRPSSKLWLAQRRRSGRRHASRRSLRTWRMVLGDLLNSLMAAHLLDRAGYSTSSALQMGPSSGTKLVWLPKGSPNDLGVTMSSPLHPPSGSLSCVLSLQLRVIKLTRR